MIPQIALPIGISFYTFQLLSIWWMYTGRKFPHKSSSENCSSMSPCFISALPDPLSGTRTYLNKFFPVMSLRRTCAMELTALPPASLKGTAGKRLRKACNSHDYGRSGGKPGEKTCRFLSTAPALSLWIGCFAYMLQIYLDFSAYSDMAIGMGLMVGFRYKENFNYPYLARSVTDFWRRWHMSLSAFPGLCLYPPGWKPEGKSPNRIEPVSGLAAHRYVARRRLEFYLLGLFYFFFLALEKFIIPRFTEAPRLLCSSVYLSSGFSSAGFSSISGTLRRPGLW